VIRVLIADDHPVVRTGYQRLLEQAGDIRVVAEAGDGQAAYAAVAGPRTRRAGHRPVDARRHGLELTRRVLPAQGRGARARLQHARQRDAVVRRAFEAGARGYLTKASPPDCVVDARACAARRAALPVAGAARQLLAARAADEEGERLATLSAREFEIFRLLAQGAVGGRSARRRST
jgi:DNA-binding NarL/FixJ family response regulator